MFQEKHAQHGQDFLDVFYYHLIQFSGTKLLSQKCIESTKYANAR